MCRLYPCHACVPGKGSKLDRIPKISNPLSSKRCTLKFLQSIAGGTSATRISPDNLLADWHFLLLSPMHPAEPQGLSDRRQPRAGSDDLCNDYVTHCRPRRVDGNRPATRAAATGQAVKREHLAANVQPGSCAMPSISCSLLDVEWRCRGIRAVT